MTIFLKILGGYIPKEVNKLTKETSYPIKYGEHVSDSISDNIDSFIVIVAFRRVGDSNIYEPYDVFLPLSERKYE